MLGQGGSTVEVSQASVALETLVLVGSGLQMLDEGALVLDGVLPVDLLEGSIRVRRAELTCSPDMGNDRLW